MQRHAVIMMRTKFVPMAILFFLACAMVSCVYELYPVRAQPAAQELLRLGHR